MPKFGDRKSFEKWLTDKPREWAVVLAARVALRTVPFLADAEVRGDDDPLAAIVLPTLRATAAPWVAAEYPTHGAGLQAAAFDATVDAAAAGDAADAAYAAAAANAARAAAYAADSAVFAVYAADAARADAAANAAARADVATVVAFATTAATTAAFWRALGRDTDALEDGIAPEDLAGRSLWIAEGPEERPEIVDDSWLRLRSRLLDADPGWRVWTDWYQARLDGAPSNEALEVARALIPNEVWREGPKAVNAEIARLIEEHTPKRPDLPPALPTPVAFEMQDGALHRAPAPSVEAPVAGMENVWRGLIDLLEDLGAGGGGNDHRIGRLLDRCREALGGSFSELDPMRLGVHADRLNGYAERAGEIFLPTDEADFLRLNAELAHFVAQFPDWVGYRASLPEADPVAEQAAVGAAISAIGEIEQAAPGLIAPDARESLGELAEAATPEPTPDTTTPLAPPLARKSFLRATRDAFLKLGTWVLERVATGVQKGFEKGVEKHVEAVVCGGITLGFVALASAIAGTLPEFAWLGPVAAYLSRLFSS